MQNENRFLSLTPYESVDLVGYEEAFEFVFGCDAICNIALTGDYGIGKSSLIRSYDKKDESKEFLYLSLMHVDLNQMNSPDNKQKEGTKRENDQLLKEGAASKGQRSKDNNIIDEIDDSIIERKLINQLIQSVPRDKIPYTSFTVKQNVSKLKFLLFSILTTLFIVTCTFTFKYNQILLIIANWRLSAQNQYAIQVLDLLKSIRLEWCFLIYIFLYMAFVLYKLFLHFSYRNGLIKNVAININNNIEMELQGESYFDNHLDDILYMFENINADAIVFEDIERFNNYKIFEQLREINSLVNLRIRNNKSCRFFRKKPTKTIRFFYLVHDNMFTDNGMAKFFDFIIPVIPALHVKDSGVMLKNHLKECSIDDGLLTNLSEKIYDYNLLKKLVNEFMIMHIRFGKESVNANELLALIIYKTLMPFDYSQLIKGKGQLYRIVNKEEWTNILVEQGNTDSEEAKSKRERYNSLSVKELIDSEPAVQDLVNKLNEPNTDESEIQLIRYLLNNDFINSNIFHYISQYGGAKQE